MNLSEAFKQLDCLNEDVEKTLQIAAELRNDYMIRSTPQVILVRAAMHEKCRGTGLIGKYIDKICMRGDEPAAGLSYLFVTYGLKSPIPNSLKKGWKKILESFDDYVISKYRMDNNFVKTRDVVNLVHAYSNSINKLMNGSAKQEKTWNTIVSNANKDEKSKKEIWTEALKNMPHMALLRNLRNLYEAGVEFNLYNEKLINAHYIQTLYKDFQIIPIVTNRNINSKGNKRKNSGKEVIVINYEK